MTPNDDPGCFVPYAVAAMAFVVAVQAGLFALVNFISAIRLTREVGVPDAVGAASTFASDSTAGHR